VSWIYHFLKLVNTSYLICPLISEGKLFGTEYPLRLHIMLQKTKARLIFAQNYHKAFHIYNVRSFGLGKSTISLSSIKNASISPPTYERIDREEGRLKQLGKTSFTNDTKHYKLSSKIEEPEHEPDSFSMRFPALNFNDPKGAHESKTLHELLRSYIIYQLCQFKYIVKHSELLINIMRKFLGSKISDKIIEISFFKHFCGGEDVEKIRPTISRLKMNGIGSILDYAAENDVEKCNDSEFEWESDVESFSQPARVYDYESEELCNHYLEVFKSCIHAVRDVIPDGFAAIKITALGNPLLLERMSNAIVEAKNLFSKFDSSGAGVLSRKDFEKGYRLFFKDADDKLPALLDRLDPNGTNKIDYIEWSKLLSPCDLPRIIMSCRDIGPLALASPSPEEIDLIKSMEARVDSLANEAFKCGTRLLIDAEQTRYQPAIDNLVLGLQQRYNAIEITDVPIIFNTYQCYLKDMPNRMILDVQRSQRESYHFGAKLVRGAYMISERSTAEEMSCQSPIHETIDDTHVSYDEAMEYLLRFYATNNANLEVMCATHNQLSIKKTIALMSELNIDPQDSVVHFAQLFGMSDNITFVLGKHNFRAYKYLPYGEVNEVIPYLIRRAQENNDVLGNAAKESRMILRELKRRAQNVLS